MGRAIYGPIAGGIHPRFVPGFNRRLAVLQAVNQHDAMTKLTWLPAKGRGAVRNNTGRFAQTWVEQPGEAAELDEFDPAPARAALTTLQPDASRRVLTTNSSEDLGFSQSVNPYRGCEHGCPYCFARPSHSYLSLSPGLDFETRIFYKAEAAEQLARALCRPGYRCQPIALGVNTDAYQPAERELRITRSILQCLATFRHPAMLITKSALIERDLDLLAKMASDRLVSVSISISSLDDDLGRKMEPRAAGARRRLKTIERLTAAGIPVMVMVAPVIPALTDHEMEHILHAGAERGACAASYVVLRLPHEVKEIFTEWLQTHYPLKADHVLSRVRDVHAGKLYDSRFGVRMRGQGSYADMLARRFELACKRNGLSRALPELNTQLFHETVNHPVQLELF